jgi:UDP-glucose 4-epimerase
MNVLVTGGSGFIGRAVIGELERRGHKAHSFDYRNGDDVLDAPRVAEAVNDLDISSVVHLAGVLGTHELFETPHAAIENNIVGALNVIQVCADYEAHYIGITMPDVFPSIYTATTSAAHRLAKAYEHSMGLKQSHVVAYNVFGPGQAYGPGHPQKIIPAFAMACKEGRPMPIWGDGSQGVDLVPVEAVANCFADAVAETGNMQWKVHPDDRVLHAGGGGVWSVLETAQFVASAAGVNPLVEFLPMRRGETPTQIVSPVLTMCRGEVAVRLQETVEWYMENG